MGVHGDPNSFQVPVCVICDRLIIGCEKRHSLGKTEINYHRSRLSVESYEIYYGEDMHPELVKEYEIENCPELKGMLLSRRARRNEDTDEFDACSNCVNGLKSCTRDRESPPRHAIANGFAIGQIPESIIKNEAITELMGAFLAPVRPYAYVFAYSAGAHRSIRGHYSFFEVDLSHTGAVVEHYLNTTANPLVYCVLTGRMTPNQKKIARDKATIDMNKIRELLRWFISESGHPGYADVQLPEQCAKPIMIEDPETEHNTDIEQNPELEKTWAGATFHFSSSHDPQEDVGVFESSQKFAKAMLDKTSPTLLVSGGNYANLREVLLENVAVLQFPYGKGGPKMKRRNALSVLETYKHYCRLSLKQFFRGDFLLILMHMFNRQQCFKTAMIKCRSTTLGSTLGEKISLMEPEDLTRAMNQREGGQPDNSTAAQYLRAITTSCQPVGYSPEAAKVNRRRHFAMDDFLGGSAIFLTTTPCDQSTLRVRIFVNAGKKQTLPPLGDPADPSHQQICVDEFDIRTKDRMMYPGACSLVYQHLMQILTECLLGWDPKTRTGRKACFGKVLAFARTDEEQGRKTLHSHWQIWVEYFNACRDALYEENDAIRTAARSAFVEYVDEVISASYGSEFTVSHTCPAAENGVITKPVSEIYKECDDKNVLRKGRHKDHCLDIRGKVLECKECGVKASTSSVADMGIRNWRDTCIANSTTTAGGGERARDSNTNNTSNESVHIASEWIKLACVRHPYDFDESGNPTDNLKKQLDGAIPAGRLDWLGSREVRRTLLRREFDEHEALHRPTCFKKGSECRALFPHMASDKTYIHDNNTPIIESHPACTTHGTNSNDSDDESTEDEDEHMEKVIRSVEWHHLDGSVEQKSQYTIIPKRDIGSQFINQHSVTIADLLACNTNVTIGDPSQIYYATLYKSKDTQAEDKTAMLRINGSFGRKVWRRKQRLMMERAQRAQNNGNINGNADADADAGDEPIACHIEGLSCVMSGLNALLSSNVVSSTMAHLLISQDGERFVYSHEFSHLLLSQMEDVLDQKEINFILRRNKDAEGNELQWPDSAANDYIYRLGDNQEIQNQSFYEWMMKYEKKFYSQKELKDKENGTNNQNDAESNKRFPFTEEHPGSKYSFMIKRKHHVIPIVYIREGKMCEIPELQIGNGSCSRQTKNMRENYAKCALMLFYPFTDLMDLQHRGSYWKKFVKVGGTRRYDPSAVQQPGQMWEYGKRILQNIQNRSTAEKKMKRPPDPLTICTSTPKSTGERKRSNIDKDDDFDMDISEFDKGGGTTVGADSDNEDDGVFEPMKNDQLRTHNTLITRANIIKTNMLRTKIADESESLLFSDDEVEEDEAENDTTDNQSTSNQNAPQHVLNNRVSYATVLSFVEGSMIGSAESNEETEDANDMNRIPQDRENGNPSSTGQHRNGSTIPTMERVAANSGKTLDAKQYIAYQIICCTFLLKVVNEGYDETSALGSVMNISHTDGLTRGVLVEALRNKGAQDQLLMFLTGPAGCGKSTSVEVAQLFCHQFCNAAAIAFDEEAFYFTSTTGSSAALFGGSTIHGAAHLNKTRLTDAMRRLWREKVRILIIDEISFFKAGDIKKLNAQLQRLMGNSRPYGGVSIVFSGDFHQLKPPCCSEAEVLYSGSTAATAWENTINCAIFLDNSHRFAEDPEYGEILARMRMGEDTLEDREEINKRVISLGRNGVRPPSDDPNVCYACPTNEERNGVTAGTFQKHIKRTHPTVESDDMPPDHTLMIEATIRQRVKGSRKKGRKVSQTIHDTIVTTLGDNDVRATGFQCKDAKIDPLLRLHPGSHHMCITNEDLDKGRGNGTLCKCVGVKFKRGSEDRRQWKNWDGRKVWTISSEHVEYVQFEHWPNPPRNARRYFRLKPQQFTTTINFPVTQDCKMKLGNVSVTQIAVNSNIATTGHKLQGMSKDTLIVNNWNYQCANWIYVVLSRVRTRSGLYLAKPLHMEREFNVPAGLIGFERRMREEKERPILERLNIQI